jgi:hypothetical protein
MIRVMLQERVDQNQSHDFQINILDFKKPTFHHFYTISQFSSFAQPLLLIKIIVFRLICYTLILAVFGEQVKGEGT